MAADVDIGAYVGVPLLGPFGTAVGMLCAIDPMARTHLEARDLAALELLAQLLHDLQQRAVTAQERLQERRALRKAVTDVVSGTGRHPVLQPIVDLTTGRVYAAEGLTRFDAPSPVETQAELATIARCGISLAQGYVLAPPSTDPAWGDCSAVEALRRTPAGRAPAGDP
jgi:predicted signal transduction protein with EAL and GGDEF domain